MPRNSDLTDLSDLERDVELDMEGELESPDDRENDDSDREWEVEWETQDSEDSDRESDDSEASDDAGELFEREADEEAPEDRESDSSDNEYVERLMEIASREHESESEVDQQFNEVLDDVSKEYFFGKIKKGLKKLAKNKLVRGLVKKGLNIAAGQFPALKAITQLARGDLKGMLLNLGKQALGAAVPGSSAVLSSLGTVGLESESSDISDREVWDNYLQISKDAFEHLADNLTEQVEQPLEASRLASSAYRSALAKAKVRRAGSRKSLIRSGASTGKGPVRHVRIRPGERLLILGAHRLLIKGL